MTIDISNFKVYTGAFSKVLVDTTNKVAYKIFKSYDHPDYNGSGHRDWDRESANKYNSQVFSNEFSAYEKVQNSEMLKNHTPAFYGNQIVDEVFDNGEDISNQFLLNCCIKIEFINGLHHDKLGSLLSNSGALEKIQELVGFNLNELFREFKRVGVNYLQDAHTIYDEHVFKIIDFGTEDFGDFQPTIQ